MLTPQELKRRAELWEMVLAGDGVLEWDAGRNTDGSWARVPEGREAEFILCKNYEIRFAQMPPKTCPFCGAEARMDDGLHRDDWRFGHADWCYLPASHLLTKANVPRWNRRAKEGQGAC